MDIKVPCFHFRFKDQTSGFDVNGVDRLVVGAEDDWVVVDGWKTFDHSRTFEGPMSRTVLHVQAVQTTVVTTLKMNLKFRQQLLFYRFCF